MNKMVKNRLRFAVQTLHQLEIKKDKELKKKRFLTI
jgi:hypothetical protein